MQILKKHDLSPRVSTVSSHSLTPKLRFKWTDPQFPSTLVKTFENTTTFTAFSGHCGRYSSTKTTHHLSKWCLPWWWNLIGREVKCLSLHRWLKIASSRGERAEEKIGEGKILTKTHRYTRPTHRQQRLSCGFGIPPVFLSFHLWQAISGERSSTLAASVASRVNLLKHWDVDTHAHTYVSNQSKFCSFTPRYCTLGPEVIHQLHKPTCRCTNRKNTYFAKGSVGLGGIEEMDSTKSLWAAVVQRRAREDQRAAQPHLLAVKWKSTIYNESHLNALAGWFEYKSTAITAAAAGDIYQRVVLLRLEVCTFRRCWTFSEQTKRAE